VSCKHETRSEYPPDDFVERMKRCEHRMRWSDSLRQRQRETESQLESVDEKHSKTCNLLRIEQQPHLPLHISIASSDIDQSSLLDVNMARAI
jgi:hypothetical protein